MRKTIGRTWLGSAFAAGLLMLVPGNALGAVIEGSVTDPQGDSHGTPSQDIVSASARYETSGVLSVSATMAGNIAGGADTLLHFSVGSLVAPSSCGGVIASMEGYTTFQLGQLSGTSLGGWLTVTGESGIGITSARISGSTITFETRAPNSAWLANRPFACMQVEAASPQTQGECHEVLDQLNTLMWFTGYGPAAGSPGTGEIAGGQCAGHTTGTAPGAGSTPGGTSNPTGTAKKAPSVLAFATVVGVKATTGSGTLSVRCGAPVTEFCTFKLGLFASIRKGRKTKRIYVGSVTGRVKGGVSGKLVVKLNAVGRKMLSRGPLHVEARGSVTNTAGLAASIHRRITIKKLRVNKKK